MVLKRLNRETYLSIFHKILFFHSFSIMIMQVLLLPSYLKIIPSWTYNFHLPWNYLPQPQVINGIIRSIITIEKNTHIIVVTANTLTLLFTNIIYRIYIIYKILILLYNYCILKLLSTKHMIIKNEFIMISYFISINIIYFVPALVIHLQHISYEILSDIIS